MKTENLFSDIFFITAIVISAAYIVINFITVSKKSLFMQCFCFVVLAIAAYFVFVVNR